MYMYSSICVLFPFRSLVLIMVSKRREWGELGWVKLQSHYSDNQSPTSDNHFFLGGCRRLSEVGKCLSMIADQSAIGCQRITSTTSRRPPTTTFLGGVFRRNSVVGKWLSMIADQSAIGRRLVVRTVGRWEVFVAASKTFRRPNFLSACSPPAVDLN